MLVYITVIILCPIFIVCCLIIFQLLSLCGYFSYSVVMEIMLESWMHD